MANNFQRSGFRRNFSGPRGARRATSWAGTVDASVGFTGAAASAKVLLLVADHTEPVTIVRTRGLVTVKTDQFAASEDQVGALGMAVVNTTASTLGATGVPGPMTDPSSELWYVYEMFGNTFQLGSAVGFRPDQGISRDIDSKAMRKVDEGQSQVIVWENGIDGNATSVLVNLRTLFKLH